MKNTTHNLPEDLREFLRNGAQFEEDFDHTDCGHVTLKSLEDILLTTVELSPGSQAIIDDPYKSLMAHTKSKSLRWLRNVKMSIQRKYYFGLISSIPTPRSMMSMTRSTRSQTLLVK